MSGSAHRTSLREQEHSRTKKKAGLTAPTAEAIQQPLDLAFKKKKPHFDCNTEPRSSFADTRSLALKKRRKKQQM